MTQFTFNEYQSLDLVKNKEKIVKQFKSHDTKWVAMEKIHGSNFSFITDGNIISCGRRNSLLAEHESFYNYQVVREKYRQSILQLHQLLAPHVLDDDDDDNSSGTFVMTVYGELFGGIYPHEQVEDLGYLHIQKGVYYCPQIEFSAFDISVTLNNQTTKWVNYHVCMDLFEKTGLFHSQPVAIGTLKEVLDYNISANSTIPSRLGLPPLQKNQMEGIVVKSVEPIYTGRHQIRAIFKLKNRKFEEVNPKPAKTKYETAKEEKQAKEDLAFSELQRYINNDNRVNSVGSKIGRITSDNAIESGEALFVDAFKDFMKDNEGLWHSLSETKQNQLEKNAKSTASVYIRDYIQREQEQQQQ
jgi:Rnl2 family RNA ligase